MCGIGFVVKPCCSQDAGFSSEQAFLSKDHLAKRGPDASKTLTVIDGDRELTFYGSVLWLQGSQITVQPLVSDAGDVLVWNGDIYNMSDLTNEGNKNDAEWLIEQCDAFPDTCSLLKLLERIKGPWSFVLYNKVARKIFFGKDCFGRHSLLWSYENIPLSETLVICSSGREKFLTEVPARGLFELDLMTNSLILHPWNIPRNLEIENTEATVAGKFEIGECIVFPVKGLNCHIPLNPVVNVSLEDFLSENCHLVEEFERLLLNAVRVRSTLLPQYCRLCVQERLKGVAVTCYHAKVAVLFSGGLDSTVLTALVHKCLPVDVPVDLLNVSFEQVRCKNGGNYEVPDRLSGREAFAEISRLYPRMWNFVDVDVCQEELGKWRASHIANLVNPLTSILDESLGCVLWFAARGAGFLFPESTAYTSEARVILVGSGADEQLGGYSRHAAKFRTDGWSGLVDEIEFDISRISSRNLGRDDRVISDHGRSGRTPFLDEHVVDFLNSLPIEKKMDLRLPRGVGDKILLRALALKLGLVGTALRPKRAMQFGTRIANPKERGSDVSTRLLNLD